MAEQVFYFRGSLPFPIGMGTQGDDFLRDAGHLADVDDAALRRVIELLETDTRFLDQRAIHDLIRRVIQDETVCEGLARFLCNFHSELKDQESAREVTQQIFEQIEEGNKKGKLLDDEQLSRLRDRIPTFIKCYPGVARQEKSRRLVKVTGQHLKDLQIICDIRPIFDEERSVVEGFMPLTIMKVTIEGEDGLPKAFEVVLSRRQVSAMLKKAQMAEQKLSVLVSLLREHRFTVPSIGFTKEDSD